MADRPIIPERSWTKRYDPATIETALRGLKEDPVWLELPVSAQAFALAFTCEVADLSQDDKQACYDVWVDDMRQKGMAR